MLLVLQKTALLVGAAAATVDGSTVGVVGLSKHLCGVATDLTLRCIVNSMASTPKALDALGVAIALCCHNGCEWDDYVGREYSLPLPHKITAATDDLRLTACTAQHAAYATCSPYPALPVCHCPHAVQFHMHHRHLRSRYLQSTLGLGGERDFETLRGCTSWCTSGCTKTGVQPEVTVGENNGVGAAEREATGRRCKRLLDAGRLDYVRRVMRMEAELVEYCAVTTSPENCLLLAWRAE
jgi:tRNA:m4X modification enzyme